MKVIQTGFEGLVELYPQNFEDQRGYFFEIYNEAKYSDLGFNWNFIQDNQSFSKKNVVRGLHFQKEPHAQDKLVMAINGKILDVVVDLRTDSPTFGKHYKAILDGKTHNQLFIPKGFAHGFAALEDSIFLYKCTDIYHKASESGIIWNDPELGIEWEIDTPIISEKDEELPTFQAFKDSVGLS